MRVKPWWMSTPDLDLGATICIKVLYQFMWVAPALNQPGLVNLGVTLYINIVYMCVCVSLWTNPRICPGSYILRINGDVPMSLASLRHGEFGHLIDWKSHSCITVFVGVHFSIVFESHAAKDIKTIKTSLVLGLWDLPRLQQPLWPFGVPMDPDMARSFQTNFHGK